MGAAGSMGLALLSLQSWAGHSPVMSGVPAASCSSTTGASRSSRYDLQKASCFLAKLRVLTVKKRLELGTGRGNERIEKAGEEAELDRTRTAPGFSLILSA